MSSSNALDMRNVADILEAVRESRASLNHESLPLQINILRNFTIDGIEPYLEYHLMDSGFKPDLIFGNYDMVLQEVLDPGSHLYEGNADLIVVALHFDMFLPDWWKVAWNSNDVMQDLSSIYSELSNRTNAVIALNTFIPPYYSDLGIAGLKDRHSSYYEILKLNHLIREYVLDNNSKFVLVDWERLIRLLGEQESMDYRFWYMSKSPFKSTFLNHYAQELVKVARALKGKSKKCLVLDCDNTLWGGIIGEDGLDGIKLDANTYPGNTFYEFQKTILKLHKKGVLITLCSKNNADDVWEVLDKHPSCLLKRKHLSAWKINWLDKASNISELSEDLNLGLDSFVFVDDNPTETGLIEEMIPDVHIYQVPKKLYEYPQILHKDGLFDTLALSNEDLARTEMYQAEQVRKRERAKYKSIDEYLSSLEISVSIQIANESQAPRISQLTQKTNQFNLTTRRYSESQMLEFMEDINSEVIVLDVNDKYGSSGLTGVIIIHRNQQIAQIDTLLMSCRVLGRKIEIAFWLEARKIIECLWGACKWKSEYIETKKNEQVRMFWSNLNFTEIDKNQDRIEFELLKSAFSHELIPFIAVNEE